MPKMKHSELKERLNKTNLRIYKERAPEHEYDLDEEIRVYSVNISDNYTRICKISFLFKKIDQGYNDFEVRLREFYWTTTTKLDYLCATLQTKEKKFKNIYIGTVKNENELSRQ